MPSPHDYLALIVDDDPSCRELVATALECFGIRTICVDDGASAREVLDQVLPDAFVFDVNLPDTTGWDLLAELRVRGVCPETPIVLMSGNDDEAQHARLGSEKFTRFLPKPFDIDELAQFLLLHAQAA